MLKFEQYATMAVNDLIIGTRSRSTVRSLQRLKDMLPTKPLVLRSEIPTKNTKDRNRTKDHARLDITSAQTVTPNKPLLTKLNVSAVVGK